MSVTFAKGFISAGVVAGLKPSGNKDFCIVQNIGARKDAAAVFTPNRFAAAPVLYSRKALASSNGMCEAVAINSGSANACTSEAGYNQSCETAQAVADALNVTDVNKVQVCSTGKIGVLLDMPKIKNGIDSAVDYLKSPEYNSKNAGIDASEAIMTTDTVPKTVTATVADSITGKEYRIGGMVKGAGMIAPAMATMICCITTDAIVDSLKLQEMLKRATDYSFNRIDSDGCMSTNDTVLLLASGESGVEPDEKQFYDMLLSVMQSLAKQIIQDAEGATRDILIRIVNASSQNAGLAVAREVSRSNLLKCALFGGDPNWGRVLASVGVVDEAIAPFDPNKVNVKMNGVEVCRGGGVGDDPKAVNLHQNREIIIEIDLNAGDEVVELWTNDLSYGYVEVNAEYST